MLFAVLVPTAFFGKTPDNPIVLGNKRVTLITPTLFRLEYAEEGRFLDAPTLFAHDRSTLLQDYEIRELDGGKRYEIKTSALRMVFDNDNLPFGQKNFLVHYRLNGEERTANARSLHAADANLGGSVTTLDDVSRPIPLQEGLLSRDGYYYIIDTGTEVLEDGWFRRRDPRHVQDMYCFVYGNDYRAALKDLGTIGGHVPMTRKYVHGIWYCRWWPYTSEEVYRLIAEYGEHDFPIDIMVLDMDWHTLDASGGTGHAYTKGWTGYTWNRELIPDPARLISDLDEDNIYVCLNEHPHDGIRSHESMYGDFMAAMGLPADGRNLLFNAGDRKYMTNFLKYAHGESWNMGVAFWWLDWQQDYLYPKVRGSEMNHLKWLNKLYYEDSARNGLRGAGCSRWAGWGDHRYPIHFSGDAGANWEMLAFEVLLSASSGNAGCYYWTHDIGGFYGGKDPELLSRWCQFGAMSAVFRIHAVRDSELDRRPWLWGEQATESMRRTYHLRSEIMPYLYTSIWQTHKTMVPLMRGMYIDYPLLAKSYDQPQQYMLGDLLLVAPITSAGSGDSKEASQRVWFPDGDVWYDYFTGERYDGGMEATITKDLNEFPLFVKGGYVLPMQPYTPRPASTPLETLVLRVYEGEDGVDTSYTLYEDDGETTDYERGRFATTRLSYRCSEAKHIITVAPTVGEYEGLVRKRAYRIEFGCGKSPVSVTVDNRKTRFVYDPDRRLCVIDVSERPVDKTMVVIID